MHNVYVYIYIHIHETVKHTANNFVYQFTGSLEKGFRVWLVQPPELRQAQRHL